MGKNLRQFYSEKLRDFGEAIINVFIFLPYFFSVSTLLRTLFHPWRNLIIKKTVAGFTLTDWANRFAFNFISRMMGVLMRLSIIIFYFIFQTLFMFLLPFIALAFFILLPFFYLLSLFEKTGQEKKEKFKKNFITDHLLNEENRPVVENWFEKYYQQHIEKVSWWKLASLFSYPPLARDWAVGYTPILDQYATDLATHSYLHHIKNIVGREKEIQEIEGILTKSIEGNVIIVGEEGVGKHTIVDALAKKIYLGKTNQHLMYRRILKLNMEKILTEFVDQKQRENFFEELLKEAQQAKNTILFIDNLDQYISHDQGKIDLTISLEKYSKDNSIQIIGITTPTAFQGVIFPNEKINRIFTKVDVYEIGESEAENILLEAVFDFEYLYKVSIPYETVKEVIEKSEFYLTYIPFPEKAVDLLDSACVYLKQNRTGSLRTVPTITPETINEILMIKTHVPTTITKQMKEKLLNLERLLFSRIVQQDEAVKKLSSSLRRSFLLIGKRKKPLAAFLFLGPTGVGKTETAKVIANVFFTNSTNSTNSTINDKYLLRFDMSEFQSRYDIPKLIGDGTSAGLLTKAVREQSYGVLLLDEIEKADKNLINIFLTILDEGYFVDGQGKRVDCKNLIVIATSNAGSDILYADANAMRPMSLIGPMSLINQLVERRIFSPEFLNRFDGVIAFENLSRQSIRILAKKIVSQIGIDIFKLHKVKVSVSEKTIETLAKKGYDPRFGARNLERTIRDEVEDKIAKLIFDDKAKPGQTISL